MNLCEPPLPRWWASAPRRSFLSAAQVAADPSPEPESRLAFSRNPGGAACSREFRCGDPGDTGQSTPLRAAINAANAAGGTNMITFTGTAVGATITLLGNDTNNPFAFGPTALVIGNVLGTPKADDLTIQGDSTSGVTISGNDARRIFGIFGGSTLSLNDVTLTDGKAVGGNGGAGGGGGGAGLGGAIFNDGTLKLVQSTVTGNSALGGSGGGSGSSFNTLGGGGGAAGYNGGDAGSGGFSYGGGGGGGVGGIGRYAYDSGGGVGRDTRRKWLRLRKHSR